MKKYNVSYSDEALKALKKMDSYQAKIIIGWIKKNLIDCENPRSYGESLSGNLKGFWRYRIGSYRILAEIQDDIVLIEIIDVGHRREVYKR